MDTASDTKNPNPENTEEEFQKKEAKAEYNKRAAIRRQAAVISDNLGLPVMFTVEPSLQQDADFARVCHYFNGGNVSEVQRYMEPEFTAIPTHEAYFRTDKSNVYMSMANGRWNRMSREKRAPTYDKSMALFWSQLDVARQMAKIDLRRIMESNPEIKESERDSYMKAFEISFKSTIGHNQKVLDQFLIKAKSEQTMDIPFVPEAEVNNYHRHQVVPIHDDTNTVAAYDIELGKLITPAELKPKNIVDFEQRVPIPKFAVLSERGSHAKIDTMMDYIEEKFGGADLPILSRIACDLKGVPKAVNVIALKQSSVGKTTLFSLLAAAFPGVILEPSSAKGSISSRQSKFGSLINDLSKYRIVPVDETDSKKVEISQSLITDLTDNIMPYSPMFTQVTKVRRMGTATFLAGDVPGIDPTVQGADTRAAWAYVDTDNIPSNDPRFQSEVKDPSTEFWNLKDDPDCVEYIRALVLKLATDMDKDFAKANDKIISMDIIQESVETLVDQALPDDIAILRDCMEPSANNSATPISGDNDYGVFATEIKRVLSESGFAYQAKSGGFADKDLKNYPMKSKLQDAFPGIKIGTGMPRRVCAPRNIRGTQVQFWPELRWKPMMRPDMSSSKGDIPATIVDQVNEGEGAHV